MIPELPATVRDTISRLVSEKVASRIWNKDPSLWPSQSEGAEPACEIMGWLDLPTNAGVLLEAIEPACKDLFGEADAGRFTDLVILGMGGSSMTPEVLRMVFAGRAKGARLRVLDTVNPETIGSVTASLPLPSTVFAVCSKSGTTVEPLSLEKHFRHALAEAGLPDVATHFIAITDAETPLAERARTGEFVRLLETPRDVGGRFSAFTAFGMFPAVAMGLDAADLVSSAESMAEICKADSPGNSGLELGAILGANALAGRDKVTLITSPGLERFGLWVEQLLAESTGKQGKGLIPVAGEPPLPPADYGDDRNFVYLRLDDADNSQTDAHANALLAAGRTVTRYSLGNRYSLGGQFFLWEFAVAVAGHVMGIFPFDQPDVNAAKNAARAILESGDMPSTTSESDLDTSVRKLIETPKSGDYVAIGAFLPESPEVEAAFTRLRSRITRKTGMATTFGFGPRYLHSTGQLYKGGPETIRFLGVVSHGSGDIKVPGESYTLGALTPAQAYGDLEVMRETGRRIQHAVIRAGSVVEIDRALRD